MIQGVLQQVNFIYARIYFIPANKSQWRPGVARVVAWRACTHRLLLPSL